MKKVISILMVAVMLASAFSLSAFAADDAVLRFDENGEFKILHISDGQDDYPAEEKMMTYINYMLEIYEPDLVVLGGDNSIGLAETKEQEIAELVKPFVEHQVYFTLVFGNHDHEQGVSKEELLGYFQKYGGKYCLAYDAVPELHGTANHNLPVMASDSDDVKFNVWLLDTGSYVYDVNDPEKRLGYDAVTADQIEWYKETSKALEAAEGQKVPSLVFQHMVVGEVYDAMFPSVPFEIPELIESYNGKHYPIIAPNTSVFSGHLFEPPSPGYYNHGEFDAMLERGDVLGIYCGHDHINTYELVYKDIVIGNTPGVTHHAYGNEMTRGSRLFVINESDTSAFTSKVITYNDLALANDDFAAAAGIGKAEAFFWVFISNLLLILKNVSALAIFTLEYFLK
ncbi:MAG: metallophosphoesterase [Clostridia bacterium]|nr:metallophosphoesterase [Clostridia bacterium]